MFSGATEEVVQTTVLKHGRTRSQSFTFDITREEAEASPNSSIDSTIDEGEEIEYPDWDQAKQANKPTSVISAPVAPPGAAVAPTAASSVISPPPSSLAAPSTALVPSSSIIHPKLAQLRPSAAQQQRQQHIRSSSTSSTSSGSSSHSSQPAAPANPSTNNNNGKRAKVLEAELENNDPLAYALSYALSLQPLHSPDNADPSAAAALAAGAWNEELANGSALAHIGWGNKAVAARVSTLADMVRVQLEHAHQMEIEEAKENGHYHPGLQKSHSATSSPVPTLNSSSEIDTYSRATVLKPPTDKRSFITRSSHLNPNARFEAKEIANNRRRNSEVHVVNKHLLAAAARAVAAASSGSNDFAGSSVLDLTSLIQQQAPRQPKLGEDEEDMFWRDLFAAQSKPGTKYHTRQLNNATKALPILLDKTDGTPMTREEIVKVQEEVRSQEERMMNLVNQLRSNSPTKAVAAAEEKPAPAAMTAAVKSEKKKQRRGIVTKLEDGPAGIDEDEWEPYTYSTNTSLVTNYQLVSSPSMRTRALIDERGFARAAPTPKVGGTPTRSRSGTPVPGEENETNRENASSSASTAAGTGGSTESSTHAENNDSPVVNHRRLTKRLSMKVSGASSNRGSGGSELLPPTPSHAGDVPTPINRRTSVPGMTPSSRANSKCSPSPDSALPAKTPNAAAFRLRIGPANKALAVVPRKRDPTKELVANDPTSTLLAQSEETNVLAALDQLEKDYQDEIVSRINGQQKTGSGAAYTESRILPPWLLDRDDFKQYFGDKNAAAAAAAKGKKQLVGSKSVPLLTSGNGVDAMRQNTTAALTAAQGASAASSALDALTNPSSSSSSGHVSSAEAQAVTHASPENALQLLALHAAEKPTHLRSEKDKEHIVALLSSIEYFSRLPYAVRYGLAECVSLHRAIADEVLFTRLHGTKFMFVFSGSVVSSSSTTGEEFIKIQRQTREVKDRILSERARRAEELEQERLREAEMQRRAERRARGLPEDEEEEQAMLARVAIAAKEKADREAAEKAAKQKLKESRMSRAVLKERQAEGNKRPAGWSTTVSATPETASTTATPATASSSTGTPATSSAPAVDTPATTGKPHVAFSASAKTTPNLNATSGTANSSPSKVITSTTATGGPNEKALRTDKQEKHALARAMLASLDSAPPPSKEIRGFQVGLAHASIWSPNAIRQTVHVDIVPPLIPQEFSHAPLSPAFNSRRRDSLLKHTQDSINQYHHEHGYYPDASESVARNGMVFHRILSPGSLFGQNDLFENSYAGIDRVLKLKSYQMRLSRVLSNTQKQSMCRGWLKLKTLLHIMITARDKAPIDSVIALTPCILLTWPHKELEKLIVTTKEKALNQILSNLNMFRELLFQGWSYKMILSLSSLIELKEFAPRTVLYKQGVIEKPAWDEKTHLLTSGKEIFEADCIKAEEAMQKDEALLAAKPHKHRKKKHQAEYVSLKASSSNTAIKQASHINNFGHNPNNHHMYLLTDGMLQLEKKCTMKRFERWPASKHTWELTSIVQTKTFFAGFIRGREIIGGETILGMDERDFTVSVPDGQTATCIIIRRSIFERIQQKRILSAVWSSMIRLRELAAATIRSRIDLRNHHVNHGVQKAVENAKLPSTRKIGQESVNEYLMHVFRQNGATHKGEALTAAQTAAAMTHLKIDTGETGDVDPFDGFAVDDDDDGDPANQVGGKKELTLSSSMAAHDKPLPTAAFAPTLDIQAKMSHGLGGPQTLDVTRTLLSSPSSKNRGLTFQNKMFGNSDVVSPPKPKDIKGRFEEYLKQSHEKSQQAKEEKLRLKAEKLRLAGEAIVAEVQLATAGIGEDGILLSAEQTQARRRQIQKERSESMDSTNLSESALALDQSFETTIESADVEYPSSEFTIRHDSEHTQLVRSPLRLATPAPGSATASPAFKPLNHNINNHTHSTPARSPQLPSVHSTPSSIASAPVMHHRSMSSISLSSGTSGGLGHSTSTASLPPGVAGGKQPAPKMLNSASMGKLHSHSNSIAKYINSLPLRKTIPSDSFINAPPIPNATPSKPKVLFQSTSLTSLVKSPVVNKSIAGTSQSMHNTPASKTVSPRVTEQKEERPAVSSGGKKLNPLSAILSPISKDLSSILHSHSSPMNDQNRSQASTAPSSSAPSPALHKKPNTLAPLSSSSSSSSTVTSPSTALVPVNPLKSFSRHDARERERLAAKGEEMYLRMQVRLAAEEVAKERDIKTRERFQREIQQKLRAYDSRVKLVQLQKEAAYAQKIIEISTRLQANIQSSYYDNPFSAHGKTEAALEISRNQAKLKQLLQEKAEAAAAAKEKAARNEALGLKSTAAEVATASTDPTHLTAEELESLGIPLPPPPLPMDDLSRVSKQIWEKHIRYLTDLEAEQRLIYADYMTKKKALEDEHAMHEHIRMELLQRRYVKGLTKDMQAATANTEEFEAEMQAQKEKADEAWRMQQIFEALNESMLAMGVAGDEEAEAALQMTSSALASEGLNQNFAENKAYAKALLHAQTVAQPLALDSVSALAAQIVAEEKDSVVINPALQMELSLASEPPITDIFDIRPKGLKKEMHSVIVSDTNDPLHGSSVGLYFTALPPPPEVNKIRQTKSQQASRVQTPRQAQMLHQQEEQNIHEIQMYEQGWQGITPHNVSERNT